MSKNRWAELSEKVFENKKKSSVSLNIDDDVTDNKSDISEKTISTDVLSIGSDEYSSSDDVRIHRKLTTVSQSPYKGAKEQNELAEAVIKGNTKRVKAIVESHFYKLGDKAIGQISSYQYNFNPETLFVESVGLGSHSKIRAVSARMLTGLFRVNELLRRFTTNLSIIHLACIFDQENMISLLYSYGIGRTRLIFKHKMSSAHVSAWYGNIGPLALLVKSGEHLDDLDIDKKTPLHLAALRGHRDVVKFLINENCSIQNQDVEGRTPLHLAASEGNKDIVHLLIVHGAFLDKRDKLNATPLHLSPSLSVVQTLLSHGADPALKMYHDDLEKTAFSHFLLEIPDFCNEILSSYISTNFVSLSAQNLKVCINYDLMQKEMVSGEMDSVYNIAVSDQIDILKHPVCESFIHLKDLHYGLKLRLGFLFLYFIFLSSLTSLVHLNHSPYFVDLSSDTLTTFRIFLIPIIFIFSICFIIYEILIILISKTRYVLSIHRCIWLTLLTSTLLYFFIILFSPELKSNFITQLATTTIFLGWFYITIVLGQFPSIGIYVLMLENVARDVIKFLSIYSFTLLAFAFSFHLILPIQGFKNPLISLLTTLTMMYGEIEFTSAVTEYHGVTEVLFVLFLVFVGIIIMNLLIGLSVSEISKIFMKAGVNRLKLTAQQLRIIDDIEKFLQQNTNLSMQASVLRYLQSLIGTSDPCSVVSIYFFPNSSNDHVFVETINGSMIQTKFTLPKWISENTLKILKNKPVQFGAKNKTLSATDDMIELKKELNVMKKDVNSIRKSLEAIFMNTQNS